MRPHRLILLVALSTALAMAAAALAHAQNLLDLARAAEPGAEATARELEAWHLARAQKFIEAREVATSLVRDRPDSYVGHFVLGLVQHYGESNFPKALYHLKKALALYERRHGSPPSPDAPWRWHARLLRELAEVHGALESYRERLSFIERHNRTYDPDLIAEQAWPLMKLGRYDEARRLAREGLADGDPRQTNIGLNALCAIEFEAGRDGESYEACKRALEHARRRGRVNAVDLTNFAEASRSLFKLAEAERVLLEATRADATWYGNPWMELAALYTRQGRLAEAVSALRKIPGYIAQRPPHVRDADRNERRRTMAAFLLVADRPEDALRITSEALVTPDRRSHNSRDPAQDRALVALLDRRARLVVAEKRLEEAVAEPWYDRWWAFAEASWVCFEAWLSGKQAARLLTAEERLVGTFRIGTAESAIMPPWMAGDLVHVAGPGVARGALDEARQRDQRPGASAYYDAFEAEAALDQGNAERAVSLGTRALSSLGPAEALLTARTRAVVAEARWQRGQLAEARAQYNRALSTDPGVFRRLGLALPVVIRGGSGELGEAVVDALERSPRLATGEPGLVVRVEAGATGGQVCLEGASGAELGCGGAEPKAQDDVDALAARIVRAFHEEAFAPRVDLSQADVNSLDGSNRVSDDPLDPLFR
jgi:tetratricopeptide (TPR) repeat protein